MSRAARLILFVLALGIFSAPLRAAGIGEIFMMLPSAQCGGYTVAERQTMLKNIITAPGAFGSPSVPDVGAPWLRVAATNYLVLERPGFGNISYKLFEGRGTSQLLAISRGRLSNSPSDPVCAFDLCLYRLDSLGLSEVDHSEIFPKISILDFITLDTLDDPNALRDITALAPAYNRCLTSNLSIQDPNRLDILTSTSLNAAACNRFLPTFELLPLTWNGLEFTKPYDRAAPKETF